MFLHTFSFIEQPFLCVSSSCVLSTYQKFQVGRQMGALLCEQFNATVLIGISINRDRDSPSKSCPLKESPSGQKWAGASTHPGWSYRLGVATVMEAQVRHLGPSVKIPRPGSLEGNPKWQVQGCHAHL